MGINRTGTPSPRKKIGIVGYGYVGKAMARFFEKHYQVIVHDTAIPPGQIENDPGYPYLFVSKDGINECDLAVVCVPTPSREDGSCDTSIVEEVVDGIDPQVPILLKSTVPPGTTDRLAKGRPVVFSPEYCGESSYWTPYKFHTDIKETPFFIFGGHPMDTSRMVDFFLPVTGPTKQYRQTSALEAEFAKYMENVFYATKIAFCYEMAEVAGTLGIDWNEARELWLLDPRINPMHTAVFEANDAPFSGKCLPKDLKALVRVTQEEGYYPYLLEEVWRTNERIALIRKERREDLEKKKA